MSRLQSAKRIVIKIGSTLLVEPQNGALRQDWFESLADDIATLRSDGREVAVVSSGAIALGRASLALPTGALSLTQAQAAASVGQIALARAYEDALGRRSITAAQILLTWSDTEERRRYLNARNTLTALLTLGAVPVINENDTVATAEIRYGDNDRLAARVASMVSADCLILLSDVDGLYTAPPGTANAEHVSEIREITPEILAMAGKAGSDISSGGMVTKLDAARIALQSGTHMVIADGRAQSPISAIAKGARCSWFLARETPLAARKRWIAATLKPAGVLTIDAGAARALTQGKSLLPAGMVAVAGSFGRGDAVVVQNTAGGEVARGLAAYADGEARAIIGVKTGEIAGILGYRGRAAMIHRDDLVVGPAAKQRV
ncbi:MAG: glutamate 5-kinase [Alphaproteobacteria bacterium]